MVQVMRTMIEVVTNETLTHLSKLVRESLDSTRDFWDKPGEQSKLLPFVETTRLFRQSFYLFYHSEIVLAEQALDANRCFRNLVTLHIRTTLLSDVFATAGYAHGRGATSILQIFMSNTSHEVVSDLGSLHRVAIWENILLKAGLTAKGIDVPPTPLSSPLETSPEQTSIPLPEPLGTVTSSTPNGVQPEAAPATTSQDKEAPRQTGVRERNAGAFKHLTHGLPSSLAPFFQGNTIALSRFLF